MAGISFNFQAPDARKVRIGFADFGRNVAELRPFLLRVIGALQEHEAEVFATEGGAGSGKWRPLAPMTQRIRQQEGLPPAGPMLVRTGRLREALTASNNPFAIRTIGEGGQLVFGTQGLPYASHQQFGTEQRGVTKKQRAFLGMNYGVWMKLGKVIAMPARPPLDLFGPDGGMAAGLRAKLIAAGRAHLIEARRNSEGLPQNWDREIERDFDLGIDAKR